MRNNISDLENLDYQNDRLLEHRLKKNSIMKLKILFMEHSIIEIFW